MFESIKANAGAAFKALEHFPARHLEKRRLAFKEYWAQQRQEWATELVSKMTSWKTQKDELGFQSFQTWLECEANIRAAIKREEEAVFVDISRWEQDISRTQERYLHQVAKTPWAERLDRKEFTGEALRLSTAKDQQLKHLNWSIEQRKLRSQELLGSLRGKLDRAVRAKGWVPKAKVLLESIKSEAQKALSEIEKLYAVEANELFAPSEEEVSDEAGAVGTPDLNAAIMKALESHSVPKSPADCSFLRGYGDLSSESTRLAPTQAKDWNILGTRGVEAVQLSSHRGPPTDRPPDKPPPWKGAFAGCSQERANTQRTFHRLAFFSHDLHCSSGNASPLADNAILGIRAIEQFRASAVSTSQRSQLGAELDASEVWSVRGKPGLCVVRGHPP
jgi:hypothetical protein